MICAFLKLFHGCELSLDQLKRRLKKIGLSRRRQHSSLDDVGAAIEVRTFRVAQWEAWTVWLAHVRLVVTCEPNVYIFTNPKS